MMMVLSMVITLASTVTLVENMSAQYTTRGNVMKTETLTIKQLDYHINQLEEVIQKNPDIEASLRELQYKFVLRRVALVDKIGRKK
jgi:hypothetical protein